LLLELGRATEAIAAFSAALAVDPELAIAHHQHGVALGALGRHAEAAAAWERSLALAPDRTDTLYNLGQARSLIGDHAGALTAFQAVVRLDASDVLVQRKVIQCLYALARHDEGEAARRAFRAAWSASTDRRVQLVSEFVFDQFEGDGFWVHAVEVLRGPSSPVQPLLAFRAIHRDAATERALPATVVVETSEQAEAAGTPYVLAVITGRGYRVLGAAAQLPPYAQLKQDVIRTLGEVLREPAR
jgi:tetratricopeptide (TPR) repeat protein